jgi:hypothetical protein
MTKPQSQQSLKDQLQDLCRIGNREGLYDAVDFIKGFIQKQERIKGKKNACKKENGR